MEVRLAYEQGLLQQPSLNRTQRWALVYMLSWNRWDHEAKEESFIKHTLAVNDWDRYVMLYAPALRDDEEDSAPISPKEFADIDEWFKKADKMRMTSAADVLVQELGPEEGWV